MSKCMFQPNLNQRYKLQFSILFQYNFHVSCAFDAYKRSNKPSGLAAAELIHTNPFQYKCQIEKHVVHCNNYILVYFHKMILIVQTSILELSTKFTRNSHLMFIFSSDLRQSSSQLRLILGTDQEMIGSSCRLEGNNWQPFPEVMQKEGTGKGA